MTWAWASGVLCGFGLSRLIDGCILYRKQREHAREFAFIHYSIVMRRFETIGSLMRRCDERRVLHNRMREANHGSGRTSGSGS